MPADGFQNRYSLADRLLHRLAFSTIEAQKGLADMEDRIYAERFARVEIDKPVFVTSLPRAGTTLLLELIASLPYFAAHTYRDMPFPTIPLLWESISRPFRKDSAPVERAHGDGMSVGYDTPEAFEELLWRAFWAEKYREDRITLWNADDRDAYDEFEPFLKNHVRKLIAARADGASDAARYVSKNNANICRIPHIARMFPDAIILVPFRNPLYQAASMLRQHTRFLDIHARDEFARRYMEYIGHFDFGANFKPIDFGNWLDAEQPPLTRAADFWLRYWRAAFEHILSNANENVVLTSYDVLTDSPFDSLLNIGRAIGLDRAEDLAEKAPRLRAASTYDPDELGIDRALLRDALAVHDGLMESAVNRA